MHKISMWCNFCVILCKWWKNPFNFRKE